MNFRNRKLVITVRTVVGLLFLFSGVMGLISGNSTEGVPADMVLIMQSLWNSGILQMIKTTETVAGLMLIAGLYPALALLFVAPVCIGIVVVNALLTPTFLPLGIVITLLVAYLGYAYWDKYKAIFERA
jgi:hypothetical protein